MPKPKYVWHGTRASKDWARLDNKLQRWWQSIGAPGRVNWLRLWLLGFMQWCSERDIRPTQICDDVIDRYFEATRAGRHRQLRMSWSRAVKEVPGWPLVDISEALDKKYRPSVLNGKIVRLAEVEFQPSLVVEVNRYCNNGGFLDPAREALAHLSHREKMSSRIAELSAATSGDAPVKFPRKRPRMCCPQTLKSHRQIIYQAATALHITGEVHVSQLKRIVDVATAKGAACLADYIAQRHGRGVADTVHASNVVQLLGRIAARCGASFSYAEKAAWHELTMDLLVPEPAPGGISERNLRLLLQFDDPEKFAMLVALPDVVMAELERARIHRGRLKRTEISRACAAIAIEILNCLPLRRASLSSLDFKRNFVRPRGGQPLLIVFPDQEKSKKMLEAALSERTWRLLKLYRKHYRPLVAGADKSTYVFPGIGESGHNWGISLGTGIRNLVWKRVGVNVHMNLWRHLMGTKLSEKRERVEDGGALLGHIPNSRSTRKYIRLRTKIAAKWLSEITDAVRPVGVPLLMERNRRKQGQRKHSSGVTLARRVEPPLSANSNSRSIVAAPGRPSSAGRVAVAAKGIDENVSPLRGKTGLGRVRAASG